MSVICAIMWGLYVEYSSNAVIYIYVTVTPHWGVAQVH